MPAPTESRRPTPKSLALDLEEHLNADLAEAISQAKLLSVALRLQSDESLFIVASSLAASLGELKEKLYRIHRDGMSLN